MQDHTTEANEPSRNSANMLGALQTRHVYAGTVPTKTVSKNRAANKAAARSHRKSRSK